MNNFDDYDVEVHRSRVAKKQAEQEAELEEQMRLAKERQNEYAKRAQERRESTTKYSTNTKVDKSFKDRLKEAQKGLENAKAAREEEKARLALEAEEARKAREAEEARKAALAAEQAQMSQQAQPSQQARESRPAHEAPRARHAAREENKAQHAKDESIKEVARKKANRVAKETGLAEKTDSKDGKKYKLNIKQLLKFIVLFVLCICLIAGLAVLGYVHKIIKDAPPIDTSDINSLLTQSSTLYDDSGNVLDNVFGDKNRTLVEIGDIPEHTQNAFIALEDKTFRTHHGFNIIRIFGAIKEAVFGDGHISGTSTITQQLARNLYMEDIMQERSIKRKLIEAYYAVQLEKTLTKDQILEAYLNCVNFGDIYGIQTASQTYFSKDVADLTIAESAWLACIPQYPSAYKLMKAVSSSTIEEGTENLIKTFGSTAYTWNDAGKDRKNTCLYLMHEQQYITDEEYEEAKAVELSDIINPTFESGYDDTANYFADYVIQQVIADLQEEYDYDAATAQNIVYNSGLQIYTTLDTQAQSILDKEFKKNENFPVPVSYRTDSNGNILKENGKVLLYKYSNYIEQDKTFKLKPSEFEWNSDGSLTIFSGKRLAVYNTTVNGTTDYSVEFRDMYQIVDGVFYSIPGGYVNIPQAYKSRDSKDNLVISAQFFVDFPNFFKEENGFLSTEDYSLRQRAIQPQSAMTIIDNKTGAVKAMIGGRNTVGRMLYNRATAPRQPGSSIKPIAVYSAALQKSYEYSQAGEPYPFINVGYGTQETEAWGDYITAASVVVDEPLHIGGRTWPKNSYRGFRGIQTFRQALQQSINVCAVKILDQVGVDYAYDLATKYGLTTLVKSGDANDMNLAALGLGGLTKGATTLEMASAYTTFVNDGVHKSHTCYTKVETKTGTVLLEPEVTETEVLNPGVAWIMRNVLQTVVSEGIAGAARISGETVGGKTGTTSDSYDIWFDGFTANYTASLWIGNDVNIKLSSMSNKAAALWSKVMSQVVKAKGGSYSGRPGNVISVTIDTKTGYLPAKGAKHTRTEYFTKGTEPTRTADGETYEICKETGCLATPSCPDTETITVMNWSKKKDKEEEVADEDKDIPEYYCYLHNPDTSLYPVEEGYEGYTEGGNEGEDTDIPVVDPDFDPTIDDDDDNDLPPIDNPDINIDINDDDEDYEEDDGEEEEF